jgi:hypothetical protein
MVMKKMYWLSALGLFGVTAGAMGFALFFQTHYYPSVQIRFPDQTVLTFLDNPWASLAKCQESNHKTTDLIRQSCPTCQITLDRCDTQLSEPWWGVLKGENTAYPVVHSASLRIVVEAPVGAKATCDAMAELILKQQHNGARCVSPR